MENELMNAIFAKEPREMYVAEGEGTWKATSLIRSVQGRILLVNLSLRSGGRICRKETSRA